MRTKYVGDVDRPDRLRPSAVSGLISRRHSVVVELFLVDVQVAVVVLRYHGVGDGDVVTGATW